MNHTLSISGFVPSPQMVPQKRKSISAKWWWNSGPTLLEMGELLAEMEQGWEGDRACLLGGGSFQRMVVKHSALWPLTWELPVIDWLPRTGSASCLWQHMNLWQKWSHGVPDHLRVLLGPNRCSGEFLFDSVSGTLMGRGFPIGQHMTTKKGTFRLVSTLRQLRSWKTRKWLSGMSFCPGRRQRRHHSQNMSSCEWDNRLGPKTGVSLRSVYVPKRHLIVESEELSDGSGRGQGGGVSVSVASIWK